MPSISASRRVWPAHWVSKRRSRRCFRRASSTCQIGHPGAALPHLALAREGFAQLDMALYRESARLAEGVLSGDDRARDLALAWMKNQGVVRPYELAATLVPGCGLARQESPRVAS